MLASYTPETINPVADVCEAAGVPGLFNVCPWEAFYFGRGAKPGQPSPFKWTYLFSFGVAEFAKSFLAQWSQLPTNKKVGVLYPGDPDGNALRAALIPMLQNGGFTVIDPGPFDDGSSDFTAQIQLFQKEECEILNSFMIPSDSPVFLRQAALAGLMKKVKICEVAKAGLVPGDIAAMGSLGYRITTHNYWRRRRHALPCPCPLCAGRVIVIEVLRGCGESALRQTYAPPRVAGQTLEKVLPVVSSPSARNSLAPLGLKVKRKFGSSEIEIPPSIEKTRSLP